MSQLFDRLPKYVQIKEAIRQEIEHGILHEGHQLASEAALIERFGASKMTVIRALQELVQEGYLRRVQGKGTYIMRPMKNAPLIGVLVPRTDRGIFSIILHSIEKHSHLMGYEVMLCSTDEDMEKVETFADRLIARKAAGVIATPLERVADPSCNVRWYKLFQDARIPVVLVDRDIEELPDTVLVQTDNEDAMAELTREVLRRGHRRILVVRWEEIRSTTTNARIKGFLRAAQSEDLKADLAEVTSVDSRKPLDMSAQEFEVLLYEHEPSVLMCLNDQIATHVYSLLNNVNTDVASKISITGFDDLPFSQAIGLTTVAQPLAEEGKAAVELLHRTIQGEKIHSLVIPSKLVIRSSLATLTPSAPQ
ncbi:MAG: GntR family transcriptional regulator [Candidatus Omnitrophota bacterium]|jgi:GntR family transcriptional regulator of arabinose operon|nr:MAG: GntR family transcriptional regulator [Candidatus Omnitrophota bacterium]